MTPLVALLHPGNLDALGAWLLIVGSILAVSMACVIVAARNAPVVGDGEGES